jgi:hypothetical protein
MNKPTPVLTTNRHSADTSGVVQFSKNPAIAKDPNREIGTVIVGGTNVRSLCLVG